MQENLCELEVFTNFAAEIKKTRVMTAMQLNAEILRNLGTLAEDESMLKRIAKYLRKLVYEKEADPTEMTKEEFFAKLERGEEEYRQGKTQRMLPGESLEDFLKRVG